LPTSNALRQKRHREKNAVLMRYVTDKLLELTEEIAALRNEIAALRNSPHTPLLKTLPSEEIDSFKGKRRASRLSPDWAPSPEERKYAVDKGLDPDLTAERYRNHWVAKAGKDGAKLDWSATWRNWCISDAERKGTLTNGHDKVKPSIESQELLRLRREEMRRAGFNFLESQ
jgi:hypothetical protein